MSIQGVLKVLAGNRLAFWCPACDGPHAIRIGNGRHDWQFNGDYDRPTFIGSVLAKYQRSEGHDVDGVCHSNITDGRIYYHPDSTHELRGLIVPMEAF